MIRIAICFLRLSSIGPYNVCHAAQLLVSALRHGRHCTVKLPTWLINKGTDTFELAETGAIEV
jgi:hypothetical protein